MAGTSIDTVVFDLGNVLVTWDRRLLYSKLIDDPAELDHFLDEILTLEVNADLDRGTSLAVVARKLAAKHPEMSHLIMEFPRRWIETLGPVIDGTVRLVEQLSSSGTRLFALTNWGSETFETARPQLAFLDHFHGVVVSGQEGVVKPDPAIWRILCDRHDVVPERSVFVDDSQINVDVADSLGFETIRFVSPDELSRALQGLGVLP